MIRFAIQRHQFQDQPALYAWPGPFSSGGFMRAKLTIACLAIGLLTSTAEGVTCRSVSSGAWSSPAIWDCGIQPTVSDDVTIASGHAITRGNASDGANTLTIEAGGELAATAFAIDAGPLPVAAGLVLDGGNGVLTPALINSQNGVSLLGGAISAPGSSDSARPLISSSSALFIDGSASVSSGAFLEVDRVQMNESSRLDNSGDMKVTGCITAGFISSIYPVWAQMPGSTLSIACEPDFEIKLENDAAKWPNTIVLAGAGGYALAGNWGPDQGTQFDTLVLDLDTNDAIVTTAWDALIANSLRIVRGVLAADGQINDYNGSVSGGSGTLEIGPNGQLWIGAHDTYSPPMMAAQSSTSPRQGIRRPRRIESNSASTPVKLPEFAVYDLDPASIIRFQGDFIAEISTAPTYGNLVIDRPTSATGGTIVVTHDSTAPGSFGPRPLTTAGSLWFGAGSDALTVDFATNGVVLDVAGDVGPEPPTFWNGMSSPDPQLLATLNFGTGGVTLGGDWHHASATTAGSGLWTFHGDYPGSAADGITLPAVALPSVTLTNGSVVWNADLTSGFTIDGEATLAGTLSGGKLVLAGVDGGNVTTSGANFFVESLIEFGADRTIAADANIYAKAGIFTSGNTVSNFGHVTIDGGSLSSFGDGDFWLQRLNSVLVFNSLTSPSISGVTFIATGNPNTVVYGGAGDQQIANWGYWDLTLQGSGLRTAAAPLSTTGALTVGPSVTFAPAGNVTVGGAFNILGGGTVDGASSTFHVAGDWNNAGTFTPNGSLVRFNGGPQNVSASTFSSVAFASPGGASLAGDIVASDLSIEPGVFLSALTNDITVTSGWSNSGTFNPGTGVVIVNSSDFASVSGNNSFNELRFQGFDSELLGSNTVAGALVIEPGASVISSAGTQTLLGNFINDGSFTGSLTAAAGRVRSTSTMIRPTSGPGSTVLFAGTGPQSISGTGSSNFFHLDINNASGVSQLSPLVSVTSELLLTSGLYSATGTNVLHVVGGAPVTRTAGWVNGNLRKDVLAPATVAFEVGTPAGYGPFTISTATGPTSPAPITVGAHSGSHPSAADGLLAATRWWSVVAAGFAGNDVTLQWNAGDVQGTESKYVAARWDGANWSTYPTVNPATHTATITGLASFSDFTVGEPNAFTPAVSLVLTSATSSATAGNPVPVTITAYDSQGAVAVGYEGDMAITFSGPATAPDGTQPLAIDKDGNEITMGSPATITFTSGVANASIKLFAVEALAPVNATDGSISTASPLEIDVIPGATSAFSWSVAASQTVGETLTSGSTLTALDGWDNVVTSYNASSNPVTLTANAPLSGSVLSSAASSTISGAGDFVSGVADLTELGVHYDGIAGTGTLTATAVSSASGTSSPVTFASGSASKLVVILPGETFTPGVAGGKSGTPTDRQAGTSFVVNVHAVDAFWNAALSSDVVALALTDSAATAPSSQAMSSGSASFTVTFRTSGSQTVTASDVTDPGVASGASTATVISGAAHKLEIQLLSSSSAALRPDATLAEQTAGVPFDVLVTAYDVDGNVVTSANDVIAFSSTDPQATLPSNTALSGGSMSGTITLRTAGVPSVTASSVTNPGVLPGVASVPVAPGPLNGFVIEAENGGPIPTQTEGQTFVIRITAVDCCGNEVSSFTDSVSVSADGLMNSGAGMTAPFSNGSVLHAVEFADQGSFVITATHSSGKNGQSAPIEVFSGCPAAPVLSSPANGATGVSIPVKFFWHNSPGAETYRLHVSVDGAPFEMVAETEGQLHDMAVEGDVQWYVEAVATDCPTVTSPTWSFTTETVCKEAQRPLASVVGTVLAGERYEVLWDELVGSTQFHLQESTDEAFANDVRNFTIHGQSAAFEHNVLEQTAFYYRVAAIADCDASEGQFSPVIRVVVTPQPGPENERWEVTVPFGNTTDVVQTIFVPGLESGEVDFVATTDQPWMTVVPSSGRIGPEGRELEVRSSTASLQVGANTGTVFIEYLNTASGGRLQAAGDNKKNSVPVTISLVTPVKPAPKTGATASNALIIPAVAHSSGLNSEWRSDVRITNTSGELIKYVLSFTESGNDATVEGKKTEIEIKPGQTVALDDVVRNWYGLGALNDGVSGVLEIEPQSASGTPGGDPMQLATVASSRTYNATSTGTFGQFIPAIPFSSFIGKDEETPFRLSLQQISQTSSYRTNIGLVEGAGQPADVRLTFFDGDGSQVLTKTVSLKAGEQQQINQILATEGIELEDGRMEVEVTSDSGRVTAYASTVDNRTGDPILIPAMRLPLDPAERYVIPGVADLVNTLANWRTDLRVFNPSDAPVPATVVFYPQNNGGSPIETQVVVPSGGVLQMNNLLRETFGLENAGGAVHVETPSNADLVVTARTYNQTENGTYGQFIPAVTAAEARGVDDRALQILQIEESDRFRTNLGLVEVTGAPVEVEVTVLDPGATSTPVRRVQLSGSEFRQLNRIVAGLGLGSTYNTRIAIRVTGGSGKVAAYASVVDNRTQDPTYVPGQ